MNEKINVVILLYPGLGLSGVHTVAEFPTRGALEMLKYYTSKISDLYREANAPIG